eukprot:TRINITY_DN4116_c0_g1_i2.p1 TRINITY_DN4116_c0_g1~~TRINITY_DN4116_c0_g1_i2.p1  ORF type:complete len:772 (+),score=170.61 TRINITY_DN4116_c0_g1_i2:124-2439(+)
MARQKKSVKRFKKSLKGQSIKDFKKGRRPPPKKPEASTGPAEDETIIERPTLDDASVDQLMRGEFFEGLEDGEDDSDAELEDDAKVSKKEGKNKEKKGDDDDEEEEAEDDENDDDEDGEDEEESFMQTVAGLQQTDPAFYEFMQKNDKSLLEGAQTSSAPSEGNDDEESEEDEDGEMGDGDKQADDKQNGDADPLGRQTKRSELTSQLLRDWAGLAAKGSLNAVRRLVIAFRAATVMGDAAAEAKSHFPVYVRERRVFNQLMMFCLRNMHRLFDRALKIQTDGETTNLLPSSASRWPVISVIAKNFVQSLMHFLRSVAQPDMIAALLQSAFGLVPYIGSLPDVPNRILKILLDHWSQGADNVRVQAFLVIHRMALRLPYPFINLCLKNTYLSFVRHSKFVHSASKPHIEFMSNCVVELYSLDPKAAYQHAFVYIRQLALHLRNALTNKTKESHRTVYNWQYINSLALWTKVVTGGASGRPAAPEMLQLVYPVVQLIVGAIGLVPTPRYYPLRFHCLRLLLRIAESNHTFINVFPYILQVLDAQAFKKGKPANAKPLDFAYVLKAGPSHVGTKVYMKGVYEEAMVLLRGGLSVYSHSVAFPELVVPTLSHVKRFRREVGDASISKDLITFIQKVEHNANFVRGFRSGFDIASAGGLASVPGEVGLEKQSPLTQYHTQLSTQRKRLASTLTKDSGDASDDDEGELFEPVVKKPKVAAGANAKNNNRGKKGAKQAAEEEEDSADHRAQYVASGAGDEEDEDVVEELVLSESDSD